MDDRIQEHARILAEHCTGVYADDGLVVNASPVAEDTAVATHLGGIGANVRLHLTDRSRVAGVRASD